MTEVDEDRCPSVNADGVQCQHERYHGEAAISAAQWSGTVEDIERSKKEMRRHHAREEEGAFALVTWLD